ncbi:MAG: pyridoxal phosphate-dependent aminotransferase [Verrucomicrobia bacterium]|nr:pyridoxal phosphate-dependent aminotransferase [Verrucomicrobiota bacterium]
MERSLSEITKNLKQSGIRAASARCNEIGGINLGQGICDLPIHPLIKEAAHRAIEEDRSIYSSCEGILPLREALSEKLRTFNKIQAAPSEIVVTHGSTGAFVCAVEALFEPGDEVILFEPFYSYHKNILELKKVKVLAVPISFDEFDVERLKKRVTPKTKGIVICTPCNPSGKVFTQNELLEIGRMAKMMGLWVITDEIYEYITYPGHVHISLASLEDFKEFTVTISGFSKTYHMTGWRLGYLAAPALLASKIALIQDLIYVCPATPLQHAVLAALKLNEAYYRDMASAYLKKRDFLVAALTKANFQIFKPQGAYYLLADFSQLGFADDKEASRFLLEECKIATVPGGNFYLNPSDGKNLVRFCFAVDDIKLEKATCFLKEIYATKN